MADDAHSSGSPHRGTHQLPPVHSPSGSRCRPFSGAPPPFCRSPAPFLVPWPPRRSADHCVPAGPRPRAGTWPRRRPPATRRTAATAARRSVTAPLQDTASPPDPGRAARLAVTPTVRLRCAVRLPPAVRCAAARWCGAGPCRDPAVAPRHGRLDPAHPAASVLGPPRPATGARARHALPTRCPAASLLGRRHIVGRSASARRCVCWASLLPTRRRAIVAHLRCLRPARRAGVRRALVCPPCRAGRRRIWPPLARPEPVPPLPSPADPLPRPAGAVPGCRPASGSVRACRAPDRPPSRLGRARVVDRPLAVRHTASTPVPELQAHRSTAAAPVVRPRSGAVCHRPAAARWLGPGPSSSAALPLSSAVSRTVPGPPRSRPGRWP
jgi:hypothetical protein